jgi:hypothetical protein
VDLAVLGQVNLHRSTLYPVLDLRMNDHPEPVEKLRVFMVSLTSGSAFMRVMATCTNPLGILDRAWVDQRRAKSMTADHEG